MTIFPLVISFYTKDTGYQIAAKRLIESCEEFGLDHMVEGIDSLGSWELNCAFKPFFIYQALQKHQKAIFWVDADAAFIRRPENLPVFQGDFAVRINDLPADHPSKVMSGSLFVNYSRGAEQFMRLWIEETQRQLIDPTRTQEFWDQIALRDAIANQRIADIRLLPLTYIKIAGHPLDEEDVPDPVIEHYQASRLYKKMISL